MVWTPNEKIARWLPLARKWGRLTDLPPALILAVIQQESGGNPIATRHEPRYLEQYGSTSKFQGIIKKTMLYPQDIATSYGLMQLMPMTAWGYLSTVDKSISLITALLDPSKNIRYASAHLATLAKKNRGNLQYAARDYNGTGQKAESYGLKAITLYEEYARYLQED